MGNEVFLTAFEIQRPPYSFSQKQGLDWLASIHREADEEGAIVEKRLARVGCKPEDLSRRYVALPDMLHENWEEMSLYNPRKMGGFKERSMFFSQFVEKVFEEFYFLTTTPPDDLIHITCTGYESPSGAQKLVARKGWAKATRVTHAYHMGCLGAIPAIRIGEGFLACGRRQVDLVHTELCSLHLNPFLHEDEQLVAQSLFADGLIKYSLVPKPHTPSLQLLYHHEELIPHTEKEMEWKCEDWGLKMTLSKEIPRKIRGAIQKFVKTLEKRSGRSLEKALYAIHPGGPKIISWIQKQLKLTDRQIRATEQVFYESGNMSSATLPHIWAAILKNEAFSPGELVVGLAFGPGLTISGTVMSKGE
ncbi:MAG: 1,3,6,8-tetrahydroxynaphthalene synthase [Chlamydiae bacterium]|nr:1,3,6,8-tetrahydroxynaphthalene synthase [Chlamydiota bacterium]